MAKNDISKAAQKQNEGHQVLDGDDGFRSQGISFHLGSIICPGFANNHLIAFLQRVRLQVIILRDLLDGVPPDRNLS